jgi:dTDP-4-amino-4,6-dideoxygalactose transaminase
MTDVDRVRMLDLKRQLEPVREKLEEAATEVIRSGWYLLGQKTAEFEKAFAAWLGSAGSVSCANGTDAVALALGAAGVPEGSGVITVPNTAFPTACAISMAGCRPVFADIDPYTWMIDVDHVSELLDDSIGAVIPVHLFGHMADIGKLREVCGKVTILEDCAQAHGATLGGRKAGTLGDISAFSFYPSKNLCALGDAGAVVSDDGAFLEKARQLRFYGQESRDYHTAIGRNSRIDEIQAAFLLIELEVLDRWVERRREIASIYYSGLDKDVFKRPVTTPGCEPSYHLYVVRVEKRDELRKFLDGEGIDSGIHYPVPVHTQPAFAHLGYAKDDFPNAELLAEEIVSLPMAPHLTDGEAERVVEACSKFATAGRS